MLRGAGSNFVWLLPLPSKPVIEPASNGLFPTLRCVFEPQVIPRHIDEYGGLYPLSFLVLFLTWLGWGVRSASRLTLSDVLMSLLCACAIGSVSSWGSSIAVSLCWAVIDFPLFVGALLAIRRSVVTEPGALRSRKRFLGVVIVFGFLFQGCVLPARRHPEPLLFPAVAADLCGARGSLAGAP